jgi:hypothetical protein
MTGWIRSAGPGEKLLCFATLALVASTMAAATAVTIASITDNSTESEEMRYKGFETISQGCCCGIGERENYVVDSQNEWTELWNRTFSDRLPPVEAPVIDFSKYTVIAVYQGTHGTGGYSIEVTLIVRGFVRATVYVVESSPGSGAFVTQALTQPYHIVKTPRITGEIIFERSSSV